MQERVIDWQAVERDYRAGVKTLRDIAEQNGISHTAVKKRATSESWDRNLSARIKARADALVSMQVVSSEVSKAGAVSENQIVEANATVEAAIRGRHKSRIVRLDGIVAKLVEELETTGEDLKTRVACAKQLGDTLKSLITTEREAWGMATIGDEEKPIAVKLSLAEGARRIAFVLAKASRELT